MFGVIHMVHLQYTTTKEIKKKVEDAIKNFPFCCGDGRFIVEEINLKQDDKTGINEIIYHVEMSLADIDVDKYHIIVQWFINLTVNRMLIAIAPQTDHEIIINR